MILLNFTLKSKLLKEQVKDPDVQIVICRCFNLDFTIEGFNACNFYNFKTDPGSQKCGDFRYPSYS